MLKKIVIKNFMSNIKMYILFFISNLFAVMELFVFWGLNNIVKGAIKDQVTSYALKSDFMIAAGIIAFITICLMIFSMKYYIQLRIKDYTTFIILGMKRKMTYLLLLAEYSIGCVIALTVGILVGRLILGGTQKILYNLYPEFIEIKKVELCIYRDTIGVSLAIMTIVFVLLLVWMNGRDLSALVAGKEKNEKRPVNNKWLLIVVVGILILFLGEILYQSTDSNYIYSHVVWVIGMFLIVAFGMALVLNQFQRGKKIYIQNVIQLNQLYSRYQNNLLILAMLLTVHFFALTYLSVQIANILPIDRYRENYPYDMLWTAREGDCEFSRRLAEKYNGEVINVPMVRVSTYYDAQHIGVSNSFYEEKTGRKLQLKEKEILVGIEDTDFEKDTEITDEEYRDIYSLLFVGGKEIPVLQEEAESQENIFSVQKIFSQCVFGQYSIDSWHENMIVFSDKYFNEQWENVRKNADEASMLILFTFPDRTRNKALKDLRKYNNKYGLKNRHEIQMEDTLYVTDEFLLGKKMRLIFSLCSKLFLIGALFLSGFFVTGLKLLTELPAFKKRYKFLRCMGMKKRQRRKNISFEVQILYRVAIYVTVPMAVVYALSFVYRESIHKDIIIDVVFWRNWVLIIIGYLIINGMIQQLFAKYTIWRIESEEQC